MINCKAFLIVFFERLLRPITIVWEKIYQLFPQLVKSQFTIYNLQFTILLLFLLIFLANYLWSKDEITKAKLKAAHWPIFPTSHFKMAQAYFNNGYEEEAKKEFYQAATSFRFFLGKKIFLWWQKEAEETNKLITKKDKIENKIEYWEQILNNKPNFRDVYLRLAVLYYQILQDGKAKKAWEKAFYLDPNNEVVQKVGKELNLFRNEVN